MLCVASDALPALVGPRPWRKAPTPRMGESPAFGKRFFGRARRLTGSCKFAQFRRVVVALAAMSGTYPPIFPIFVCSVERCQVGWSQIGAEM